MTTRELNAREKARAKAMRAVKADLKKSDGWRLGEFSSMSAYDRDSKLESKKFVFLCECYHGLYEVWTWIVEVDMDTRKKAVIMERGVREVK